MKLRITTYPKRVNAIQGLVKLEFGEDLTVYPLRIVQGKNGLFLSMPQAIRKDNSWKDLFHPVNKEARQELTEAVMKVFSPEHTESMEVDWDTEWEVKAYTSPFVNPRTKVVGMGTIELNGRFRVENILLSEIYPGTIVPIFPMRQWMGETGEIQQADILTASESLEKLLGKELRKDFAMKQKKQQQNESMTMRPRNSFNDFEQRTYPPGFLDELIRRKSAAESKQMAEERKAQKQQQEAQMQQEQNPEPEESIGPVLE